MLIEFRVENHRSLRDEQVLTMEAAKVGAASDPRPCEVAGYGKKLLPAAVIYGANASGKSNLLDALAFMRDAVLYSHRYWEPDSNIPRKPFAWGKKLDEPSMFEVSFLIKGTKYVYGFSLSDHAIEEEWLTAWPRRRPQVWFEREGDRFKFGAHLKGPNDTVKEVTRSNALFLSVAFQHRHEQLSPICWWFKDIAPIGIRGFYVNERPQFPAPFFEPSFFAFLEKPFLFRGDETFDSLLQPIRRLLRAADVGIVGIKYEPIDDGPGSNGKSRQYRLLLQHESDDKNAWLDFNDESDGTKALFKLGNPIVTSLLSGGLLLIDELESSLHPLLVAEILKLFECKETNRGNAQVLCTTHDTNLLGTTLGEPALRRDQIWFTEKDKTGATDLYPLTDYKPRKAENLERGYLQGRYGAIPFLGQLASIAE